MRLLNSSLGTTRVLALGVNLVTDLSQSAVSRRSPRRSCNFDFQLSNPSTRLNGNRASNHLVPSFRTNWDGESLWLQSVPSY